MTRAAIIAVLTSFNRRSHTLAALQRLEEAARGAQIGLQIVLVDDASTDGTADAVRSGFPTATVIEGDGDLFWNRGMYVGMVEALIRDPEYILWLNDDTELAADALMRLVHTARALGAAHGMEPIVVGSTADRATGTLTYGGHIAPRRWRPFTYRRVWSETEPVECHAMNGNVVLIPRGIAKAVGNIDPVFEHAMGDTDYALRARACGFRVFVAPGIVGWCTNNPTVGTFRDRNLTFAERWKKMMSRKGLPPRSWLHFTRRHGGAAWPLYFVWPYARLALNALRPPATGRAFKG